MARIKSPLSSLFLILIICSLACEIDSFPVFSSCEQKPTNPVCAVNGRTFRNQCCLDLFNRNGAKRGFYLAKARNGPCNQQRGPFRSGLKVQEVYNKNGYYPNEISGNTVANTEFKGEMNQVAVGHDKYNIGLEGSVNNHHIIQNSGPPAYGSGFYGGPTDQYQAEQQQKPKPSYNNNYGQDQDQSMKHYQAPYNYLLNKPVHHSEPISTSNKGNGPIYSYNYGVMETTTTPGITPSPPLITTTTTTSPLTTPRPLCPTTNPAPITFPTPVVTTVPPLTTPTEVPTTIGPEFTTLP